MTTRTPAHVRRIWKDTRPIVSVAKPRPAPVEQPQPAAKTQAEKEADRWVAQMMFENYNP